MCRYLWTLNGGLVPEDIQQAIRRVMGVEAWLGRLDLAIRYVILSANPQVHVPNLLRYTDLIDIF